MGIIFNNVQISQVIYNNNKISKVIYNNDVVFGSSNIYNYPSNYIFVTLDSDCFYFYDISSIKNIAVTNDDEHLTYGVINAIGATKKKLLYPTATSYGIGFGAADVWDLSGVEDKYLNNACITCISGLPHSVNVFTKLGGSIASMMQQDVYYDGYTVSDIALRGIRYNVILDKLILDIDIECTRDVDTGSDSWTEDCTLRYAIQCDYSTEYLTNGKLISKVKTYEWSDEPSSNSENYTSYYVNPYTNVSYMCYYDAIDNYYRYDVSKNGKTVSSASGSIIPALYNAINGNMFSIPHSDITISYSYSHVKNQYTIYILKGTNIDVQTINITYDEFPDLFDKDKYNWCSILYDTNNIYFLNETKQVIAKLDIDFESGKVTI